MILSCLNKICLRRLSWLCKNFFEIDEKNIKSWEEIIISVDETKFSPEREIILIQANVKSNPDTTKQITTFKDLITQILANKAI